MKNVIADQIEKEKNQMIKSCEVIVLSLCEFNFTQLNSTHTWDSMRNKTK